MQHSQQVCRLLLHAIKHQLVLFLNFPNDFLHVYGDNHFLTWHNSNFLVLMRRSGFCCCFYMLQKSFTFSSIWKDFCFFSHLLIVCSISLNISSFFKWDICSSETSHSSSANFTKLMLRLDVILVVAVRNTIIGMARYKILVHWTNIMLGWNIQPVWSISSSVMADWRVIFLNMTYDSVGHFLRNLGLSTTIVNNNFIFGIRCFR